MRSRGVSRVFRQAAFRAFGIVVASVLTYSSAPFGINSAVTGFGDMVKAEFAKVQNYNNGYTDRPNSPRRRTSSVGRTPLFRGGIRNMADHAELMRNEQARLAKRAASNPDLLLASTSPMVQPGGPGPTPVGDAELGEGSAGGSLGVGFEDRHEGGGGPKPPIFLDNCAWWCPPAGMGPCIIINDSCGGGGGGGGGGGTTGGLGSPPDGEIENQLNTNTGNLVTVLPITGRSGAGNSFVEFTLVHNSMQTDTLGAVTDIGHSWTHNYSIEVNYNITFPLSPPSSGDVMYLIWMDGQRIKFSYDHIDAQKGYAFKAPPGYHAFIYTDLAASHYLLETKDQWSYDFNKDGFVIQQTDPWGNAITINRAQFTNEISTVDDGLGRSLTFTYSNGKIEQVQSPDLKTWKFTRDLNGNLIDVEYPQLNTVDHHTVLGYNSYHDIASYTNKLGKTWNYLYDQTSRLLQITNPLSKTWWVIYSVVDVVIHNPVGGSVRHVYQDGRLLSYTDEAGYSVSFWADTDENLTRVNDKKGNDWYWDYDANANLVKFTDPMSRDWEATWTAENNIATTIDPQNNTVLTYGYLDAFNNTLPSPTSVEGPLYASNSGFTYLPTGELNGVYIVNPGGFDEPVSWLYYDSDFNLDHVTSGSGLTAWATYDVMGRPLTVTNTAGETTTVTYDDWGRPERQDLPDTFYITISINEGNQVVSAVDQLFRSGSVFYNDAGYVTSTLNANNETTSFGYDDAGRLLTITNGRGKTRTMTYKPRHEVETLTLADGQTESWNYDGNGNVSTYTNGLGQVITYDYNSANDQTGVDYPTGTDTSFGYDALGRWNSMTDATGTTSWVHNILGQVTSLTTPQGSYTYTFNAQYGRPETTTDVNGVWSVGYDQWHRSISSTNPFGETTSVTFDNAGRVNRKDLDNGMYETYSYDVMSRLDEIRVIDSSNVIQDIKQYVWDEASRVTSALEGGVTTTYTYDNIDQLLSEVKGNPINDSRSYTYDKNGNRTTRVVNNVTETYYYNDADKLTSIVGGANPRTYTYDLAGRTKTISAGANVTTFNYNYEGEVTSIGYPNQTSDSFGYNGLGARMSSAGVNGSKTFRRAGLGVTSSVLSDGTKDYTPGVSSRQGSTSTFQHSGLKNVLDQTDSSQNVTASRHYDAFGNLISSNGTWQGPFGYAGDFGYQEDGNGLKLLGHRYYDSDSGRFLTSDPAGWGSNWYGYADNNPITNFDFSGLRTMEIDGSVDGGVSRFGPWLGVDWGSGVDFSAGWGDGLTFGGTAWVRKWVGEAAGIGDANESVNTGSVAYGGGRLIGEVHGSYLTGAGLSSLARAGKLGKFPKKWGGRRTNKYHWVRIESGPVHLFPGLSNKAWNIVNMLHLHIKISFLNIDKLHLFYQLWPMIQGGRLVGGYVKGDFEIDR